MGVVDRLIATHLKRQITQSRELQTVNATETERANSVKLATKHGDVTLTSWGDKATVSATTEEPITINRIPYRFTMHLARETVNYAGEPYDQPFWRIDGGGVYIYRLDDQFGLGEPTQGARSFIYNTLKDAAVARLNEDAELIRQGHIAHLESKIANYQRDLDKLGEQMNETHDKIREATEELRGL